MPDLIERLEKLLAQATPGPWKQGGPHYQIDDPDNIAMASFWAVTHPATGEDIEVENRDLAVAAANAMPLLLRAAKVLPLLVKQLPTIMHPDTCGRYSNADKCDCGKAEADAVIAELTAVAGTKPEGAA